MKNFLNSYKKTFDFKYLYLIIKSKQKKQVRGHLMAVIKWANKASKQMRAVDSRYIDRILEKIELLQHFPGCSD